jgi:cytochrome b561
MSWRGITEFCCSVSGDLPNPIGPAPVTAEIALWVHLACAMLLLLPLETHIGLVLGHHFGLRDRLIHRMLPGRTTHP